MIAPYRVLVTGSRDWDDIPQLRHALNEVMATLDPFTRPVVIVHGACPTGADAQANAWAREMEGNPLFVVTVERHPAGRFGPWPACGPIRNRHMVSLGADTCLAFIGPCTSRRCSRPEPHGSHGASGCADLAEVAGIPVQRFEVTT